MVAGISIGGFGAHTLKAQGNSPVYMIEDNTVRDPDLFAREFAPLARESLRTYGGLLGHNSNGSQTCPRCRKTAAR
jgi:hypothetical protein